ncbi:MAG: site-specific DNA-methyltransferase, partial [Lentisphaeria bacterium]|nr:site-specific DNA-methyltransferase [Lentisphaeria bacterium]
MTTKPRAKRNRTLTLTPEEYSRYAETLLVPESPLTVEELENRILHCDLLHALELLPDSFADLI